MLDKKELSIIEEYIGDIIKENKSLLDITPIVIKTNIVKDECLEIDVGIAIDYSKRWNKTSRKRYEKIYLDKINDTLNNRLEIFKIEQIIRNKTNIFKSRFTEIIYRLTKEEAEALFMLAKIYGVKNDYEL